MSDMQLLIVTPQGKAYSGAIKQVVVPGELGGFSVLRGHAPLIAALEAGVVRVQGADDSSQLMVIDGGFLEVRANNVVILANRAEAATDAQQAAEILKARRAPAAPAKPQIS